MTTKKLLLAGLLGLAVLAAGCMGGGDESTNGNDTADDDAFNNDSVYGGDAGVTPDESGMGNQTNETNSTNETSMGG